ncbi:PA3371 family protein [Pseudomonas sp. DWP3-1-2]|uniref:PA3371 family protein n=1 Tax=Pseudomonas sp. DWP3-1-2 TaxID=2804645 RepID=UPI003CF591C2
MSKLAVLFVILAVTLMGAELLLPREAEILSFATKIGAGVFFFSFLIALMAGRRFKFDPVLR